MRTAQGGGLKVSIAADSANAGDIVRFRLTRAPTAKGDGDAQALWESEAQIQPDADFKSLHAIVAPGEALTLDPERPFLVVDAVSGRSRGAVNCKQPTRKWEARHRTPVPDGLHGPYDGVNEALKLDEAGNIALGLMGQGSDTVETGYVIVRDRRLSSATKGAYYTSPPVRSTASEPFFPGAVPTF